MLTPDQIKQRNLKLTASMVAPLMTGDESKLLQVYYELTGDERFVPEDLTWNWPVQRGANSEPLNLRWYEYKSGHPIDRRGEVVVHPVLKWAACTLDGWDVTDGMAVECKDVGGREARADVIARYMPQLHWIMMVTSTDRLALSIIEAGREPVVEIVPHDDAYGKELLDRADTFMNKNVYRLVPPYADMPVAAPKIAERIVDMSKNNKWVVDAETWLSTRNAARDNADAAKLLKAMCPDDAVRTHGGGIEITRSRTGALTIRERRD